MCHFARVNSVLCEYIFKLLLFNRGFQVTYSLIVNNIYPTSGSAMGGSVLTITGSGFSTTPELNNIMFGETECRVLTAESTEVINNQQNK